MNELIDHSMNPWPCRPPLNQQIDERLRGGAVLMNEIGLLAVQAVRRHNLVAALEAVNYGESIPWWELAGFMNWASARCSTEVSAFLFGDRGRDLSASPCVSF